MKKLILSLLTITCLQAYGQKKVYPQPRSGTAGDGYNVILTDPALRVPKALIIPRWTAGASLNGGVDSTGYIGFNQPDSSLYVRFGGSWIRYPSFQRILTMSSGGGGAVSSVFGRTGAVTAATNDYSFSQISGSVADAQLSANIPLLNASTNTFTGNIVTPRIGLGGTNLTATNVRLGGNIGGGATSQVVYVDGVIQSDVTTAVAVFRSNPSTLNASFTTPTFVHFRVNNPTKGASHTITNHWGLYIDALTSGTNNYAIQTNQAVGYNIYAAGVAPSYFAGNVGIGQTTATARLHLPPGTAAPNTAPLKFTSGVTLTAPEAGVMNYDGTNFYLTPSSTIKRIPLINNATPSNGQIPIGNGTDFTTTTPTGTQGVSITTGSGTLAIGLGAITPTSVSSGGLTVSSTTAGSVPAPVMTTTQRNAIASPTEGLQIYNSTAHELNYYDASSVLWRSVANKIGGQTFSNKAFKGSSSFGNFRLNSSPDISSPTMANSGDLWFNGNDIKYIDTTGIPRTVSTLDNAVTITGSQTVSGAKNFSSQITNIGGLRVNPAVGTYAYTDYTNAGVLVHSNSTDGSFLGYNSLQFGIGSNNTTIMPATQTQSNTINIPNYNGTFLLDKTPGVHRDIIRNTSALLHNPGNTTEATILTSSIPSGSVSATGGFVIKIACSATGAGTKTVRIKINGVEIYPIAFTGNSSQLEFNIDNRTISTQILGVSSTTGGTLYASSSGVIRTSGTGTTTDFSVTQPFTLTAQLGTSSDTVTVEKVSVTAIY